MSKGLGKVQLAIIEELRHEDEDIGFIRSSDFLEDIGFSQRSINRAINGLIAKGLVTRDRETYERWGGGTTWRYNYMLVENEQRQIDFVHKRDADRESKEIAAKAAGYKSYGNQLIAQSFS